MERITDPNWPPPWPPMPPCAAVTVLHHEHESCLGPYCSRGPVHPPDRPGPVPPSDQVTSPRPVIGGRSRAVSSPGDPSTTAGMALTRRMAVALSPAVLW